jgi:SPP1 family predicted phage head-tail adaptor
MTRQAPILNKRIDILRRVYTSDDMGGFTHTTIAQGVWAQLRTISGSEIYKFGGSESNVKYKFTIRYRGEDVIEPSDEIGYMSRTFRIHFIDYMGFERNYVDLYCIEDNA